MLLERQNPEVKPGPPEYCILRRVATVRGANCLLPRKSFPRGLLLPPERMLDPPDRTDKRDAVLLVLLRGEPATAV